MSIIVQLRTNILSLSYGVLGNVHPTLPKYQFVHLLEDGSTKQRKFADGSPAEAYYPRNILRTVGTAFIE